MNIYIGGGGGPARFQLEKIKFCAVGGWLAKILGS